MYTQITARTIDDGVDPLAGAAPAPLPEMEAWRPLLAAVPWPMWIQARGDSPPLLANDAALRQYGYDEGAFLALSPAEIAPQGGFPEVDAPHPRRMRHRRRDGHWLEVEVSVRTVAMAAAPLLAITARPITPDGIERRRLGELVNSLDGIVWEVDARSMRFRFVSPQAERLLGYPLARWSEPTFWVECIHPVDRERALACRAGATAAGRDYECDYRMVATDGRVLWLRDVVSVLVEDGVPVSLRGVSVDVTASKRAELERAGALALLNSVLDSIPAQVALVDLQQRYRLVNQHYAAWFGVSAESMVGQAMTDFLRPGQHACMQPHIRQALSGQVQRQEKPVDDLYGNQHWMETLYVPQRDGDGRVDGFATLAFDISERKRAESALAELNGELERRVIERTAALSAALRELESFSYAVSHDLTAPLRALDGFSSILLDDYGEALDASGQDHLRRIRRAAARMSRLIDDLLKLSRLSRLEMRLEYVDLSRTAAEVMLDHQRTAPQRRLALQIEPGLVVRGDSGLLRVVLDNLLGNAWKYSRRQAVATISFGCGSWRDRTAYFVSDNGVGFDSAYAGKLFGAFQRLHSDPEFEGSGIGLATVQRIVRRHGGDIWADAKPECGATFWFTLGEMQPPGGGAAPIE